MKEPIVIGIGEYLWDMLPEGKKAGGAPVNFAFHASNHGVSGWAVSSVGKDELGFELIRTAREHGINLCVSQVDYPTGTVKVTLENGIPSYEICEGVAWDHLVVLPKAAQLAGRASAICFGSLAQRSAESRAAIRNTVSLAPAGALIVFDINLRQHFYDKLLIEESLQLCNVLKINDEELEVIKPMLGMEGLPAGESCRKLLADYSLKMVILTAGDKFSSVYSDTCESTLPTPKVEVVDTVGAGDSFTGAFVASIINGLSIEDAHRIAVQTAAQVCTKPGSWI